MQPKIAEPALILRPLPRKPTPHDLIGRFGGLPRLPEDVDWPGGDAPMLFVAEIDLALLPVAVEAGRRSFPLPRRPLSGRLCLFWDARDDGGHKVEVLHIAETAAVTDRHPPEGEGEARASSFVDPNGLSPDGLVLRSQALEVLPYLSSQGEAELGRNMDRAAAAPGSTAVLDRDLVDARHAASLDRALGRADYPHVTLHFPWLPNTIEPAKDTPPKGVLGRLTSLFRSPPARPGPGFDADGARYGVPESFPWRWSVIRAVARGLEARALMRDRPSRDGMERVTYDFACGDAPAIIHVWREVPAAARAWLARCPEADAHVPRDTAEEFRAFLRWVDAAPDRLEVLDAPDPRVLTACAPFTELADAMKSDRALAPARWQEAVEAAKAIIPMMACLRTIDDDESHMLEPGGRWDWQHTPLPYYTEWDARHVTRRELIRTLSEATHGFIARVWREDDPGDLPAELTEIDRRNVLRATTLPPLRTDGNNYGDDGRVPIQMFGAGYLLQNAARTHADKVLLFQLSRFGLPAILPDDGLLQVWINAEDLAEGRFDHAFGTFECT